MSGDLTCPFCGTYGNGREDYESYLADGWLECRVCECHGPHNDLAQADPDESIEKALKDWVSRSYRDG